jgi:hypothetical protein
VLKLLIVAATTADSATTLPFRCLISAMHRWAIAACCCAALTHALVAQTPSKDATPSDAVPAILDLFKTYQVVGLGEGPHGNLEGHLFRLKLLRDPHAFAVLKRESLSKNRKALVVYGDGHFQGRGFPALSLTVLIERAGVKMITISSRYGSLIKIQPSVASWKTPSFAMIRGTTIGEKFYAQFYPMPPAPGWNRVLMQDQFDAVVYLSPKPPTMTVMPKELCRDAPYMKMRIARLNAVAPGSVDDLKKLCANLTR